MATASSQARPNPQPLSSSLQDEIFVLNNHTFRKTTWNGISVIQDMATGYYQASGACSIHGKRFEHWMENKGTKEYLQTQSILYRMDIQPSKSIILTEAGKPASVKEEHISTLLYRIQINGNAAIKYAKLQGYYIHPDLLHDVCYWANKVYAAKVSRLMNLINERNRLLNQTLEQTIAQYEEEITRLKQEVYNLEDTVLEQTLDREFLSFDISKLQAQVEDLNTPINQSVQPSSIYASPVGDSHFQLRYSKETISDSSKIKNLKHIELINAKDVLDLTRKTLKKSNETSKLNGKVVLPTSKLDQTFDLISGVKQGNVKLPTQEEINNSIDEAINSMKLKRLTPQVKGKIFELEQLKQGNYMPWSLIPKSLLERTNEQSRDCGIDGLKLNENSIEEIVQIKYHNKPSYLNINEIKTFMNKCNQARYKNIKKKLILHGCKLGKQLGAKMNKLGINIEIKE